MSPSMLQAGMTAIIPGIRGGYTVVEVGPQTFDDGTPLVHLQNNRTLESLYRHVDQIMVIR